MSSSAIKQHVTADDTNLQGKPVNSGKHTCSVCQKQHDAFYMQWTTDPKLCIACYYDL